MIYGACLKGPLESLLFQGVVPRHASNVKTWKMNLMPILHDSPSSPLEAGGGWWLFR